LYLDRGRLSEALDHLTVALKEEPDYLDAAYNRAVALQRLGRVGEAEDVLSDLRPRLRSDPRFDEPRRAADASLGDGVIGAARDEEAEP
jgi:tetratricopeptide (TPR) repeat protein